MKFVTRKELKERLEAKNMWCTWFKLKMKDYNFTDHYAFTNLHNGYLRISYDDDYFVNDNISFDELINVLKDLQKGYKHFSKTDVYKVVINEFRRIY